MNNKNEKNCDTSLRNRNCFLSGILNETIVRIINAATLTSNDESERDEGSTCDVKDSAFNFLPGTEDGIDHNNEVDINFLGDGL